MTCKIPCNSAQNRKNRHFSTKTTANLAKTNATILAYATDCSRLHCCPRTMSIQLHTISTHFHHENDEFCTPPTPVHLHHATPRLPRGSPSLATHSLPTHFEISSIFLVGGDHSNAFLHFCCLAACTTAITARVHLLGTRWTRCVPRKRLLCA